MDHKSILLFFKWPHEMWLSPKISEVPCYFRMLSKICFYEAIIAFEGLLKKKKKMFVRRSAALSMSIPRTLFTVTSSLITSSWVLERKETWFILLTLVWQRSTGMRGRTSTFLTGRIRILRALHAMPPSTLILALVLVFGPVLCCLLCRMQYFV